MLDLCNFRTVSNDYPEDSEIYIAIPQQPDVLIPIGKVTVEFDTKTGDYKFVLVGELPKI